MLVLMVTARYRPFVGGIETHINEVGTRMVALGHTVVVLTTDPRGALPEQEIIDGILVRRVKAWPRDQDFYFAPQIYTEITHQQCDIIHFQGWNTLVAPLGMVAAIYHKIPFVLTFHSGGHSSPWRNAIRGVQRALNAPLAAQAAHLIGCSEFEADFFSEKMGIDRDRFTVVPNGASLPPPSDPPPLKDPHLVLSVGRLEHYKGHHRVIEAFPDLLRRVPDAHLKIVGAGPYGPELRALVHSLHLEPAVGFVSLSSAERQQLTDTLCSAGLFVSMSEYEAHPVAVMEALSVGLPVLAADTSGLREIAEKGWCRSVPLDASPRRIAAAIFSEFENKQPSMEVSLPNWDDCTEQLLTIYQTVLDQQQGTL